MKNQTIPQLPRNQKEQSF